LALLLGCLMVLVAIPARAAAPQTTVAALKGGTRYDIHLIVEPQ